MDIQKIVNKNNYFNMMLNNDIKIVGKIDELIINNYFRYKVDLSEVDCNKIIFELKDQYPENICNYILPNNLKILNINNLGIKCLPTLPDSLEELYSKNNNIKCLPKKFPSSLKYIDLRNNKIKKLPNNLSKINELIITI
tara:strand:+ start:289 stop:708 length:420 start_codon:yes stop_codon:yes gene_type:complete